MERLPTELLIQILNYMSKEELKVIGFISSEYRSLVLPLLFRRIRPWSWAARRKGISNLISCLQNNVRLSSVVRVLDAQSIRTSGQPVEEIRRIMEIATWWEELILLTDDHIPLSVFDDNTKLKLRRLQLTTGPSAPELSGLLLNILPACTNLVDLEIPRMEEGWFETIDPIGSASVKWINRLEKYCGPPYPLNYLRNDIPLYQLTSKAAVPSQMLQRLGQLVGQQLLALHVRIDMFSDPTRALTVNTYLQPSLIPSLFPNLQYAAWFLIMSQSGSVRGNLVSFLLALTTLLITHIQGLPQTKSSGDEAPPDVDRTLFDAISQLHHLRQVWFISHHSGNTLPEPVSTFVEDIQRIFLPYLRTISLWTPNSDPCSYSFTKEEMQPINEGRYTIWACETNKSVYPSFN